MTFENEKDTVSTWLPGHRLLSDGTQGGFRRAGSCADARLASSFHNSTHRNLQARIYRDDYLEGNTRLKASIAIYRSLGFVEIPLQGNAYERCDILMEYKK